MLQLKHLRHSCSSPPFIHLHPSDSITPYLYVVATSYGRIDALDLTGNEEPDVRQIKRAMAMRGNEHGADNSSDVVLGPEDMVANFETTLSGVSIATLFIWEDQSASITTQERLNLEAISVGGLACTEEKLACLFLERLKSMAPKLEPNKREEVAILGLRQIAYKIEQGEKGTDWKYSATGDEGPGLSDDEIRRLVSGYKFWRFRRLTKWKFRTPNP